LIKIFQLIKEPASKKLNSNVQDNDNTNKVDLCWYRISSNLWI